LHHGLEEYVANGVDNEEESQALPALLGLRGTAQHHFVFC
jgi:hypothetical protein